MSVRGDQPEDLYDTTTTDVQQNLRTRATGVTRQLLVDLYETDRSDNVWLEQLDHLPSK